MENSMFCILITSINLGAWDGEAKRLRLSK